jgi:hypothetical protein
MGCQAQRTNFRGNTANPLRSVALPFRQLRIVVRTLRNWIDPDQSDCNVSAASLIDRDARRVYSEEINVSLELDYSLVCLDQADQPEGHMRFLPDPREMRLAFGYQPQLNWSVLSPEAGSMSWFHIRGAVLRSG